MSDRDVDGENPYEEPKTPLEGPARKTGFTTIQGVVIVVICTTLFLAIYRQQQTARIARARAAVQKAADALARRKALLDPPARAEPPR